jgi:plasmid maintenance system killer protein
MGSLPFAGKTVDGPGKLASRAFQQGIYRYCHSKLATIPRAFHHGDLKVLSRQDSQQDLRAGDLQVLSRKAGQQGLPGGNLQVQSPSWPPSQGPFITRIYRYFHGKMASRTFEQGIYRYCHGKLASKAFQQGIYRYCHGKLATIPRAFHEGDLNVL